MPTTTSLTSDAPSTTTNITIRPWHDPTVERHTHTFPANSDQTLVFWTPLIGPTAAVLLHRLASYAATNVETTFTLDELAQTLGVHPPKAIATIRRLERHGLITVIDGTTIGVRLVLPPLTAKQIHRLPEYLAQAYLAD